MSTSLVGPGATADAPIPLPTSSILKHVRDFYWLLRSELFLIRTTWFWYLVQLAFVPISYMVFLFVLIGRQSPDYLLFSVTGSLVTTVSTGAMLSLGQHLGFLKDQHAYEYYATLPISKTVFIAAIATRGVLLSLPSVVIVLVTGYFAFGIAVPPAGLAVLVLSAYSMAGLGAFIGFWSPTAQVASLSTQVLQTVITFLAPVFFPPDVLPGPWRLISLVLPTTQAARALRASIAGGQADILTQSVLVLLAFTFVSLVLVPLKLEWRQN